MNRTTVSIIRAPEYGTGVYDRVREAVDKLGGISGFVKKGERILIKPNLLIEKSPDDAVTTHPDIVAAAIRLVKEAGATPVVGDSPCLKSAQKVAEKAGILEVCKEAGVELIEFTGNVAVDNPGGFLFRRLEIAKEVMDFDGIINLPKLKTHAQMFLTLGIKNLFGCVAGKAKPQWHLSAGTDSQAFAAMILDLHLFLKPRLSIMDGIVGMEGNGPGSGDPVKIGLLLASADAVAMDTVITELLGAEPEAPPIQRVARGWELTGASLRNIDVLGEKIADVKVERFKFPPLIHTNFADKLPYFIESRLRKAITTRPHVHAKSCVLCNKCVNICPATVMSSSKKIRIDYNACIRCFCCQEACPVGAISPKDGWLKKIIPGL